MKNSIVRKLLVGILTIMLMSCLTGCVNPWAKREPEKQDVKKNVVVLMGNTANEASFDPSTMKDTIKDACKTCGTVSIIQLDGDPYLVDTLKIPAYKDGISDTKKEQIASNQCAQIMAILEKCEPKTPELDVLKGLQMASRQLAQVEGEKVLLVASSGLATKGLVNFADVYLEKDQSKEILENLDAEKAIPNFSDTHIVWTGMGDTIAPQIDLYDKHRDNLMNTWKLILEESTATSVDMNTKLSVETVAKEGVPDVSEVPILQPASLWSEGDFAFSKKEDSEYIYKYDGDKLSFKPGSPELLTSEKTVQQMFEKLIKHMKEDKSYEVLLVGTTASAGTDKELKQLSLKRTETVKQILVNAGASLRETAGGELLKTEREIALLESSIKVLENQQEKGIGERYEEHEK